MTQRAAESDQRETTAVSAFEGNSKGTEGNKHQEQRESDFEGGSDDKIKESEDIDEVQEESEDQRMSMGM